MSTIKKLRPRHQEIIRLAHSGMRHRQIGDMVGLSSTTVSCILRSPMAQAELARLKHEADLRTIDTPLRVRAALELDNAAMESLRFNAALVRDPMVDKKLRARVATHFLDRVVFDKNPQEQEGSYREILRSLNEIERQMTSRPVTIIESAPRHVVSEHDSDPPVTDHDADEDADALSDVDFVRLNNALRRPEVA